MDYPARSLLLDCLDTAAASIAAGWAGPQTPIIADLDDLYPGIGRGSSPNIGLPHSQQ